MGFKVATPGQSIHFFEFDELFDSLNGRHAATPAPVAQSPKTPSVHELKDLIDLSAECPKVATQQGFPDPSAWPAGKDCCGEPSPKVATQQGSVAPAPAPLWQPRGPE